jgi:hypothetical protein
MKNRLFEFEDQNWFPAFIRNYMTEYLRFLLNAGNLYLPVTPLILEGLKKTGSEQIVDLCSGGGGPMKQVHKTLQGKQGKKLKIVHSDKFPNKWICNSLNNDSCGDLFYEESPVNASSVPSSLKGFRTMFSAIHHFDITAAKSVIQDAVDAREGIGIFDGGDKKIIFIFLTMFFHALALFLITPLIYPFKFSRLFFTYILPVIPICVIWDGVISLIRLYHPFELLRISMVKNGESYVWKAGKVRNKFGLNISYLLGYPAVRN